MSIKKRILINKISSNVFRLVAVIVTMFCLLFVFACEPAKEDEIDEFNEKIEELQSEYKEQLLEEKREKQAEVLDKIGQRDNCGFYEGWISYNYEMYNLPNVQILLNRKDEVVAFFDGTSFKLYNSKSDDNYNSWYYIMDDGNPSNKYKRSYVETREVWELVEYYSRTKPESVPRKSSIRVYKEMTRDERESLGYSFSVCTEKEYHAGIHFSESFQYFEEKEETTESE